jgi:hypothetical protein
VNEFARRCLGFRFGLSGRSHPMASEFPPPREAELVPFSENFKAKIAASPGDFSLTSAQASAYGTLHDDFIAKWDVCQDPTTKTKQAVELKDQAKNALLGNLRMLVKIVQNAPTTTNAERIELNIPERDFEPTPVPPPADAPMLTVVSVYGRNIRIKLDDASGAKRGRPISCQGAMVYSFVGANPPAGTDGWKLEGLVTRRSIIVEMAETVPPGSKVFLTACWYTERGLTGPACTPVATATGYEGAMPLAG